jgi:hypothetical protein
MALGVDSASNRNEYQEYFLESKGSRCVGLTTLPHPCADCLDLGEPHPPGNLRVCPDLNRDCFNFQKHSKLYVITLNHYGPVRGSSEHSNDPYISSELEEKFFHWVSNCGHLVV